MRALVTGAAGFIGFHLARSLLARGYEVILVDNFVRGVRDKPYEVLSSHPRATALSLDLTDLQSAKMIPTNVDVVFHLAALNGTQNFYADPYEVMRCSTLPTFALLERFRASGLARFVYAGSSEAYAAIVARFSWPVPTDESVPLGIDDVHNPRWSYATSKLHGEILTINGCRQFGTPFTIIRYHNAYGPRMGDKHVIPDFLIRARNGVLALYGHEDTRSFLYVDDAVRATIALSECPGAAGEVVNVGGRQEMTIRQLGELMKRVCGLGGEITLLPSPKGSVRRRAPDLTKLRNLIGEAESVTIEDGLARTAAYYLRDVFEMDASEPA